MLPREKGHLGLFRLSIASKDRVREKKKSQDSLSTALLRGCITTDRGKWTVGASIVETICARERPTAAA
jgi:hypothetical protein